MLALGAGFAGAQDLMRLKKRAGWSEHMVFSGSAEVAMAAFSYNEPGVVDEEYEHIVWIKFMHPQAELMGRNIKLPRDTAMITVWYQRLSAWDWSDPRPVPAEGRLRILKSGRHGVKMDQDLSITPEKDHRTHFRLVGTRAFREGAMPWRLRDFRW